LRILLTGARGQVGSELALTLPGAISTDRSTLDLADPDSIRRKVREVKPEAIINAAAYTAVDTAESERDLASRVNALAPGVLGEEAKRLGALLVHYSTDYVFDGEKRSPYSENDAPNPLSHYARTKLEGERAIAASGCRYLVLRTSWVYGPRATNFYQIILRNIMTNAAMLMANDQTSVPTPSRFLAVHTVRLIERSAEGLLHLVPSGAATRYEFALEVVRAMGARAKVSPANASRFPAPASRPGYSVLDNRAAARVLGQPLPEWKNLLVGKDGNF
jgi:dTDP-4-dehydrorhamnose reductase